MAKLPTFTPDIEDCLHLDISVLNKKGLLKTDFENAEYSWNKQNKKFAAILLSIKTSNSNQKILTIYYNSDNQPISYQIMMVSVPTNLGNGKRWYFICPNTGKRCMKLIKPAFSNYFFHRTAFTNLMYASQKRSKQYRRYDTAFGWLYKEESILSKLNTKYRKRHYRGKPTPLVKKLQKLKDISHLKTYETAINELERVMVFGMK